MKRIGVLALLFTLAGALAIGCSSGGSSAAKVSFTAAAPEAAPGPEPAAKANDRKIRYTATVEVAVKNLDAAQETVETLVKAHGGYVAKSELAGAVGDRRRGSWTIKIPVEAFRETVAAFARLGTLVRNSSDSEDFTEEFLDLEARLRNLKTEEDVLNKLLKEGTMRLDDVLKMREQIVRNRGEIERNEGRLKYLASVTSFSTINLMLREQQDYQPPSTPSFGSDVTEAFDESSDLLLHFGRGIALIAVSLAPWLPVLLVAAFAVSRLMRRMTREKPRLPVARRVTATPEPPASEA